MYTEIPAVLSHRPECTVAHVDAITRLPREGGKLDHGAPITAAGGYLKAFSAVLFGSTKDLPHQVTATADQQLSREPESTEELARTPRSNATRAMILTQASVAPDPANNSRKTDR